MLRQTHTVLVVDDEPAMLRMLERTLRGEFNVLTARDAYEAMQILTEQRDKISLILTDQRMPGMTGTELLRLSQSLNPDMIRIMITANNDNETFIEAIRNAGVIKVIAKPWDPDSLIRIVKDSLEKYDIHRKNKEAIRQMMDTNRAMNEVVKSK